ncbi:MAG: DUF4912 domain-containing protein [Candidatus Poribacteria bacterium]|nr:DUF4912 domain-containing protein [Candidatus Poribacteria bacterium]
MPKKRQDDLSLEEAAEELGISRAALYGRIRRSRKRGERVPFRRSGKGANAPLVVARDALMKWDGKLNGTSTSSTESSKRTQVETKRTSASTPTQRKATVAPAATSGANVTSPLAPSAERSAPKEPLETEPVVTTGSPVIERMPDSYIEDRVVAMLHDPDQIVVYWDVHPDTARRFQGARWGLLVRTDDGEDVIEIGHGARNWYITKPNLAKRYEVSFGPFDARGVLIPIAMTVWTPKNGLANPHSWGRCVLAENGASLELDREYVAAVDSGALFTASQMPQRMPGSDIGGASDRLHQPSSADWHRSR